MDISLGFILIEFLNALTLSSLLFLFSVGLTIIFGIMRVVNFAHGATYMTGAYIGYATVRYTGLFWLAAVVSPFVTGLAGIIIEALGLRYLYKRVHIYQFLFTFGVAFILEEIVKITWGVQPKSLDLPAVLESSTKILGEFFPNYRLFLILMGMIVALGFWLFLEKTRIGIFVRAAAENSEMVASLGINVNRLRTFVFWIGACLAGLGGVLAAPLLSIFPEMGIKIIVEAFVVVIVGGLGSFSGTILGSLAIGFAQTFGNLFFPEYSMTAIYAAMAVILIFLPNGFCGREW
jgi:branched-chain amino acid transport system permease protein